MAEVAVRKSRTAGRGVFTLELLRLGEVVREFVLEREVTPEAPLRPELGESPEHCPLIDGRFYLVGSPERYLNHSCDPNVYLRFEAERIEIVALRDIEPECGLSLDYLINNPGGDSWPCECAASRCRGETGRSFFALPEDRQREYLPLLAPWFSKRYSARLEHLRNSRAR